MNILVEALTVNNFSGRHVFNGMLEQTVRQSKEDYRFIVLYNFANRDILRDYGSRVQWVECASWTQNWAKRILWMRLHLNEYIRKYNCEWLYTPSGCVYSWVNIKQASYVANPWALAYPVRKNAVERLKAKVQAHAYANAVKRADLMIYISDYMRVLFNTNAKAKDRDYVLFYSGIKESTFQMAAKIDKNNERIHDRILTVSVMTPHKNLESIAKAMPQVLEKVPSARWVLVGKWADEAYRLSVLALIRELNIEHAVEIIGYLDDEALEREYAKASVYCLMSQCESFGIPAVEAQAYQTPVVGADCCAVPEVCGEGGNYFDSDDVSSVANELIRLLTDEEYWKRMSDRAVMNADRFHWDVCARELVEKMNMC